MAATFAKKRIEQTASLGELLTAVRENRGWSIAQASKESNVEEEHLKALEEHRYDLLPSDVYIRNYIRLYCKALKVDENEALDLFEEEYRIFAKLESQSFKKNREEKVRQSITFTPRTIRVLIILAIVAVLASYLLYLVTNILQPPQLEVFFPENNTVTREQIIKIRGVTETETILTINGQPVNIDELGNFEERINLQPGLNVVEIISQKEHSRPNRILRNILVEE